MLPPELSEQIFWNPRLNPPYSFPRLKKLIQEVRPLGIVTKEDYWINFQPFLPDANENFNYMLSLLLKPGFAVYFTNKTNYYAQLEEGWIIYNNDTFFYALNTGVTHFVTSSHHYLITLQQKGYPYYVMQENDRVNVIDAETGEIDKRRYQNGRPVEIDVHFLGYRMVLTFAPEQGQLIPGLTYQSENQKALKLVPYPGETKKMVYNPQGAKVLEVRYDAGGNIIHLEFWNPNNLTIAKVIQNLDLLDLDRDPSNGLEILVQHTPNVPQIDLQEN
ncbi:MAG: hypothetical protein ACYCQJ_15355 [Nitrososphaerales archaeon]